MPNDFTHQGQVSGKYWIHVDGLATNKAQYTSLLPTFACMTIRCTLNDSGHASYSNRFNCLATVP